MRSANDAKPEELKPRNRNRSLQRPVQYWLQAGYWTSHITKVAWETLLRMKANDFFFPLIQVEMDKILLAHFQVCIECICLLTVKMSTLFSFVFKLKVWMFFQKKNSSIHQYFNLGVCIIFLYGLNERRNKRINHSQKETDNLFLSGSWECHLAPRKIFRLSGYNLSAFWSLG